MGKSPKRPREEVESDEYGSADDNLDDDMVDSEEEDGEDNYDDKDEEINEDSDEDSEEAKESGGETSEGSEDEDSEESEENGGEMNEGSEEDSEGEEIGGEMYEVSDEEEYEEGEENGGAADEEIDELEKEYNNLQHEEQDLLANIRKQKSDDSQKGQAVKNQKTLWNKSLEFRFLLQKPYTSSNRLPQEPVRSQFVESDEGVRQAYAELISSSEKTIDSILELQNALVENNPYIAKSAEGKSPSSKIPENKDLESEADDKWTLISQMHVRMASYRDRSIDKWNRKTQVTTGAASIKGRFQALNQNISQQVAAYMRDPSRMIKQMQARRSTVGIFGMVPEELGSVKDEDGDPDLLDDIELYQQLLKEFFETFDPSATEAALYKLKRSQVKKRKTVDRRASKSRKIRYNIHEKIVNFMAPEPANIPPMAPKLFENLFGLKSRIPPST